MMIRIIHGVGHGAFYTETFLGKNSIVYDCGADKPQEMLNEIIDDFHCFLGEISVLFVSHFHSDHINGIQYLLKKCKVKRLVIPYLNEEEKRIILVAHLLAGGEINDFTYRFIENTEEALGSISDRIEPVVLIRIREQQMLNEEEISITDVNTNTDINSGTRMLIAKTWYYVPFNLKDESLSNEITKYFEENLHKKQSVTEDWWKSHRCKLTSLYEAHGKSKLNTNSLVVYSGTLNTKCGCLYTGDYNAKTEKNYKALDSAFSKYWDNILTLQVPHHGSKNSFNKNLIREGIDHYFISAGEKDRYKHPNIEVLREFADAKKEVRIITEKSHSPCCYWIFHQETQWNLLRKPFCYWWKV
jgi:beta-lactamase superfamily II metal-dependent hydrolase